MRAAVVPLLLALTACSGGLAEGTGPPTPAPAVAPPEPTWEPGPQDPAAVPAPQPLLADLTVAYRVEVRSPDPALADAATVVEATLTDPRGWARAGWRLVRDDSAGTPLSVVLAEPAEVDRLCAPYKTAGKWSCQNGPVVALNADRWRGASEKWTGDLDTYRQMLVNHEVGHLLGLRHPPSPQCPVAGRAALVMSQQSSELDGCLPNPWPLDSEVEQAVRLAPPLAPPFDR